MAMEQGLYAQVVMISRKDLKFIAANRNKNEAKFKFQGKSAISQSWFDLDFDWIEANLITHDTDLNKEKFQIHDDTQDKNTFKIFQVPTGNIKCVQNFMFHNDVPMLKHLQKLLNISCLSSLALYFASIEQTKAANDISFCIE